MTVIKYQDLNGYGVVSAPIINIYLYGPINNNDRPVNPIVLISQSGTYHFGCNRAFFVMGD